MPEDPKHTMWLPRTFLVAGAVMLAGAAPTLAQTSAGYEIDYSYCKGCGVCNAECPRGAMDMTREGL